jgi:heterodisulfide reductase subunit C2
MAGSWNLLHGGMMAAVLEIDEINGGSLEQIASLSGASPMSCYQCQKCTSGCPVAARSDLKPHEVVRLMQMEQFDEVLSSRFIWECTSCHTCATRCPQKVDIASINDALRVRSRAASKVASQTAVPILNDLFINAVCKRGRIHELSLMAAFKLRTKRLFADFDKLPMMLSKRKLPFIGSRVGQRREREAIFLRVQRGGR